MEQAARTHQVVIQEVRIVRRDHAVCWTEVRCNLLAHVNAVPYLMLMFWDIQQYKNIQMQKELLTQKYDMMEIISHEFPFDLDVESWTMLRSHKLMEMRGNYDTPDGYHPVSEEVALLHPQDQEPFTKVLKEAARMERSGSIDTRFNVSIHEDNPCYVWFRTFYKSVTDEEGRVTRIIGRSFNIDSDKKLQEEVRRDPLTKLLNKIEVQNEITKYLEERASGTHAMFLIEVDNF